MLIFRQTSATVICRLSTRSKHRCSSSINRDSRAASSVFRPVNIARSESTACQWPAAVSIARTVPRGHAKGNASLSLMPPTLPSAASAYHSECHSEYRRHTGSLHGAVFLDLPRRRCKKSGIAPTGTIPDLCLFSADDVCKRSHIKGLQVSSRFVNAQKIAHISLIAACAAARRAMGTRKGEQDT